DWVNWQDMTALATAPRMVVHGESFGLHNRDLPTLWALYQLATMVHGVGAPVRWRDYTVSLARRAEEVGKGLRSIDCCADARLQPGTGFPKAGPKASASVIRFIAAYVGRPGQNAHGPFFLF